MASIKLEKITKKFKNTIAVNDIDLQIEDGEFFCILGPPGAGKTTLLRLIMGLEKPDGGNIVIDNESVIGVHPSKRDIAMIFQNLALYPDKTVFDNIAFPLKQQKVEGGEIRERVDKVAKDLHIDWLLDKIPSQLSGGERQRVAIGRAIVRQPKAYLMDEPLSNLDALLRLEMRVSLKELQDSLKETFVYVTHDQVEALSMGDRIAVMHQGILQQIGDPDTIYQQPNNMFVATILGSPPMNFLKCSMQHVDGSMRIVHKSFSIETKNKDCIDALKSASKGEAIVIGLRPEDIEIQKTKGKEQSVPAEIYVTEPLGNETIVDVALGENVIKVLAEPDFEGQSGQKIWISINSAKLHMFHDETHECVYHASAKDKITIV
ncbi:MAG: ABC transporter ATP-binding protein [Spirochaetota bacterium]|nr:MAG: ABC transporter ATP-binding protein [Spirochaetota bacterium]